MDKKKNSLGGSDQGKSDGAEAIKNEVPESRFQGDQQVQETAYADKAKAPINSFSKEKVRSKGAVLKQEVASSVVTKGLGGEVPSEVSGLRTLSYSGNAGTILGSTAYTPEVGKSRSNSRYGKKLDSAAKKINFVASEQVEEVFDESKPLAQNPDAVQGYNGTYRNTNARAQKVSGGVPAELMFQRSLDEVKRDQLYFSEGQVVDLNGVNYDTPRYIPEISPQGDYVYPSSPNYNLKRGNFLNRFMNITVSADGTIKSMTFDTIDISTSADADTVDKASSHAVVDRNHAEMTRQIMDFKAGDENGDNWTPLARAIKEPTKVVGYLRDLESITGAHVWMAYKKTALAHSYMLNKAAKDGMKIHTPMIEALCGAILPEVSSADILNFVTDPFKPELYAAGSASAMIALYDSVSKYNTKADVLLQPRSIKMHLQTAENNMNPLKVKEEFVKCVNSREVFSTIDRDYDPLLPVCISDREGIINCYDFNQLYSFDSVDEYGNPIFNNPVFKYMYSDERNKYVVTSACPLLAGLHSYLSSIGAKLHSILRTDKNDTSDKTMSIPIVYNTTNFSLWALMVLAATPFILNERVNSMRDVLYYEKNFEYPFAQLLSIKEANPMSAVNYVNDDYMEPIKTKTMTPSSAITWVLPELFWPFDELTLDDTYRYVLPWYFNEEEFVFSSDGAIHNNQASVVSFPSVRSGARFGYLDLIYQMDERDVRLCLDRLVQLPVFATGNNTAGVYKYSQNSDGIPFVQIAGSNFTIKKFLSLARELGNFVVAPMGLLQNIPVPYTHSTQLANFADENDVILGNSSYSVKIWHGRNILSFNEKTDNDQKILLPANININRGEAYKQDWDSYHCITDNDGYHTGLTDFGFVLSLNDLFLSDGSTIFGRSKFIPFTKGHHGESNADAANGQEVYTDVSAFGIISLQKALWTRIQKLPFALSPFDVCASTRKAGEDANKVDPFDFLYYFGLAGFRGSDYREDTYNRLNQVVEQGFNFLSDPFIEDSPIFKEATVSTQ